MSAHDLQPSLSTTPWLLDLPPAAPEESAYIGALLHLSNGRFGIKATADLDDPQADPGFFSIEVYNTGVGVNREIVNLPNPLGFRFRVGGLTLRPGPPTRQVLDMGRGLVRIEQDLSSPNGVEARYTTTVLLHATRPELGMTFGELRLRRGAGPVAVESAWDNSAGNPYLGGAVPSLRQFHVSMEEIEYSESDINLHGRLAGTERRLLFSSRLSVSGELSRSPCREFYRRGQTVLAEPDADGRLSFWETWSVQARNPLRRPPILSASDAQVRGLVAEHCEEWRRRWAEHGIEIEGDPRGLEAMRFGLFNLLQHEFPVRPVKITPARGLSSSYHSGATFFDTELHKDAYWAWTAPEVAKSHLMYRVESLPAAREFAAASGFRGARFPEAANDLGRENGPHEVLAYPRPQPAIEWSVKEVLHNSADVAYAVRRYHQVVGDDQFMADHGVELVLEAARFADSVFRWDEAVQAYTVRSVMGPDEYHYHVDNSYFTNSMLRWSIEYALALVDGEADVPTPVVAGVSSQLGIGGECLERWREIVRRTYLPAPMADGVPTQFDGYGDLPDCALRTTQDGPVARLSEGETELAENLEPFATKLIKQGDIVLLAHLQPELFDSATAARSYRYYEPRTAHESSLSAAPHGVLAARLGWPEEARSFFYRSSRYNLDYRPRTGYRNGLHLSAYAGAWQILVEGLLGLRVVDGVTLELSPRLPSGWQALAVPLSFRGRRFRILVRQEGSGLRVRTESGAAAGIPAREHTALIELGAVLKLDL